MKNQSNNNHGIMSSIGNAEAIAQRETANKTNPISAYFMFGSCDVNGVQGANVNHTVKVVGWMKIQETENQLKNCGCSVASTNPISQLGIFYCIK